MTYTLQAVVAGHDALQGVTIGNSGPFALPQGMALLPIGYDVQAQLGVPFLPLTDGGEPALPEPLSGLMRELSSRGKAAYVEAEFFGGTGVQACVLADHGCVEPPRVSIDAINQALRFLGVTKAEAYDEFDAVGLGRHRRTEDWR